MEFRIADTFADSLARLNGEEQKAVKTTAFDLQINPAQPSLQFHRIDRAKDPNFWSVRVSSDIRLIVHKNESSLLLCYVDHHDKAYAWAARRKLETHPKTGAAQLVEIRETIQEITIPAYVQGPAPAKPLLFAGFEKETLLGYGVPAEWIADVLKADEDTFFVDGMGGGRGCLAIGDLGSLSGRGAPGPKNAAAGSAARPTLGYFRACPRCFEGSGFIDAG